MELIPVSELSEDTHFLCVPGLPEVKIEIVEVFKNDDSSWTVDTLYGTISCPNAERKLWAIKKQ